MQTGAFPLGFKRAAAMVVLHHGDYFLLLKRRKPPYVGHYLPVGGKLEPHEDPYSAARRELLEETGIADARIRYGGVLIETSPTDYNWQSSIYIAEIDFVEPPHCPEGELEWIAFNRLPHIPTPPTDWMVYQYLVAGKPFAFNAVYDEKMQLCSFIEEIEGISCLPDSLAAVAGADGNR